MDNQFFSNIHKGLIVSCQAEGNSPFNNPQDVAKFALCAQMGGAVAIRTEGLEKAKAILQKVDLPVIGLIKSEFENGYVRITGRESDVADLAEAGCHMVAVDGTFRLREHKTGPESITRYKKKYKVLLMADIATFEEAVACAEAGADCLSTTLSGYTPCTVNKNMGGPDFELLKKITQHFQGRIPVIAEGRYNTPGLAAQAIEAGAWAVVTGTAITRPQMVTKWFDDAIKKRI